jgi:hypothetical protein
MSAFPHLYTIAIHFDTLKSLSISSPVKDLPLWHLLIGYAYEFEFGFETFKDGG